MQVFQRHTAVAEAEVPARGAPELRLLRAIDRERRVRALPWYGARVLGALALLSVGAVHLQQYLYLYSAIPTSRVAEAVTVVVLGGFLLARLVASARAGRRQ